MTPTGRAIRVAFSATVTPKRTSVILRELKAAVEASPKVGPTCCCPDTRACTQLVGERCKAAVLANLDENIAYFESVEAQT